MQALMLLSIVVATVCIVSIGVHYFAAWLQRPSASRVRFISNYAFPAELERRVLALHPELDADRVRIVIEGLRQYFLACLTAWTGGIARHVGMPSKAVDDAWHEFILMTRDYASFCRHAFGRYLHHVPDAQMSEPMGDALANTLHQLNRPAPSPAGWATLGAMPLLFAIDRELGVTGGYSYDAPALAQLEQKRVPGTSRGEGGGAACGAVIGGAGGASCDAGSAAGCDAGGAATCGGASCGGGGAH